MNIWDSYCKADYYNVYFNILVAKGLSREQSEDLKIQFSYYLQRIKGTLFAKELKACVTPNEFKEKLHDIFYNKWKNYLKNKEIPFHFEAYLSFLDSMQALHNDYINDEERNRLVSKNFDIPIEKLSTYETDYMRDGKLVALMNPQLLSILKEYIEDEKLKPRKACVICESFYGDLLPQMEEKDYATLIQSLWGSSHKVRSGAKKSKLKITYPDGREETYAVSDGMISFIRFYGAEEVRKLKHVVRGEDFIVKNIPYGKEDKYEQVEEKAYVCISNNSQDRMKLLKIINVQLGKKLKVELV